MHLFVIYLEPLLAKLEQDLGGFKIGSDNFKLRAYVDDVTIVITSDEELVNLGTCLDDFCSLFAASISKTN